MKKSFIVTATLVAAVLLLASASVKADQSAEERMLQLEERINQLENALAGDSAEAAADMKNDAAGRTDDWLTNFKLYGQLRLRYNMFCFSRSTVADKTKTRKFGQIKAMIGLKKTWLDETLTVVMEVATGQNPTTQNDVVANNMQNKTVYFHRAYAKYAPNNCLKGLVIYGGKMPNPWVHTDLMWDADVNPEGLWAQYNFLNLGAIEPFVGMGLFALDHNPDDSDAEFHAYSVGFKWEVVKDVKWTSAVTYYDYGHFAEDSAWFAGSGTASGNNSDGGELLARDFNILNLTNKVTFVAFGMPMNAFADFAHNCGNENGGQSDAISFGGGVGENKVKGDWSVGYKYKYIQADSVVGQFADATFGGANRKGHVLSAKYNITDFLVAAASLYYTQAIVQTSGAAAADSATTSLLLDLIWSF